MAHKVRSQETISKGSERNKEGQWETDKRVRWRDGNEWERNESELEMLVGVSTHEPLTAMMSI
jgi:hypothetical protein